MFFVMEGVVAIYSNEGTKLARFTQGQCFGEIALINSQKRKRTACALAATDVSLAVLEYDDFCDICKYYPIFLEKIEELIHCRSPSVTPRGSSQQLDEPLNPRENLPFPNPIADEVKEIILKSAIEDPTLVEFSKNSACNFRLKYVFSCLRFLAALFNFVFIPLQVAFRIQYTIYIYVFEGLIITIHLFDIFIAFSKFRRLHQAIIPDTQIAHLQATGKTSFSALIHLGLEIISLLPFCMILQNVVKPTYLVALVKYLRLIKFWPISAVLSVAKQKWVSFGRLLQIIVYYLFFIHILVCLLILMMYIPDNYNQSWVKRIPYPNSSIYGYRTGDDLSDAPWYEIYLHFMLGEQNSTTYWEMLIHTIYIIIYMYVFVFLFADITSLVTDTTKGLNSNIQTRMQELIKIIKCEHLSNGLLERIKSYFCFVWESNQGIDEGILEELPDTLKKDIRHFLYIEVLKASKLFRILNHKVHDGAISSFLRFSQFNRYSRGDIIVKAGSKTQSMVMLHYIIMRTFE